MSLFQVLSTKIAPDGWADMNVLTPYGIVSIEFRIDKETVQSFNVSACLYTDINNKAGNSYYSDDALIDSLLAIAEGLAGQDNNGRIAPFKMPLNGTLGKNISE